MQVSRAARCMYVSMMHVPPYSLFHMQFRLRTYIPCTTYLLCQLLVFLVDRCIHMEEIPRLHHELVIFSA
jgi:hypothetical protein